MVTIVDYGMGNLGSVLNMFKKVRILAKICANPEEVALAEKLVLPGVGHFEQGMENLEKKNFIPILNQLALEKKIPVLGICLGMQLMGKRSQEGDRPGLGWMDAESLRFDFKKEDRFKVPHMGWNFVDIKKPHPLVSDYTTGTRFYFVHSYYVKCSNPADILMETTYGHSFVSGFQRENLMAFQFHPEKSHKFGMQLFKKFGEL